MKPMVAIVPVIALAACLSARADEAVTDEMQRDVVLRALVDELERGRAGLTLEDLQRPYFIEYALYDLASAVISADLGAIARTNSSRARRLRTDVRVGSYELDNTNFTGSRFGGFFGRRGSDAAIPIEDDYEAVRQAVWWSTDREYKSVLEAFAQKSAEMESRMIEDKPDDFSRESPTVHFEQRITPTIDLPPLERLAVELSRVFREFPDIQNSNVRVQVALGNRYLVNSEGTRLRTAGSRFSVTVSATVQADDGMELSDSVSAHARQFDGLPGGDALVVQCREMCAQLLALRTAPVLESYSGPVLLEPEVAATLFAQNFRNRFTGGQRPVGSRRDPDDFETRLERRILPRFLNVVDDPTRDTVAGVEALGHYAYDDQGVKARPVTLVERGRLKALLMSRNPSKAFQHSTGHGRGAFRVRSAVGCMNVTAVDGVDHATLIEELLDACADEGLEHGIRLASLGRIGGGTAGFAPRRSRGGGSTPLAVYKVFPGGREELVRGVELGQIDLKAFKRMLSAGDTPYVANTPSWLGSDTVAAPAMLFEELDLAKADRDFDKPPILPSPLAREGRDGG